MAGTYCITGASSGIGLATAARLARGDANLVLVARAEESLELALLSVRARGGQCLAVSADVRDEEAVGRALDTAIQRFGSLDGVVHSAGVAAYGRFEDVPADVFAGTIAINLLGTATVARASLQRFRAQGHGRLVVLGSALGSIAAPWMSPYVASKWGVNGLVRTLQIETRDNPRISVSLVSPGGVDTPIHHLGATYLHRHGRPFPPVQDPDAVAARVIRALNRGPRRVSSNPLRLPSVAAFHLAPAVFDAVSIPLMGRLGLDHDDSVPPTTGNVFDPLPRAEGLTRRAGRRRAERWPAQLHSAAHLHHGGPVMAESPLPGVVIKRDVEAPASAVWQVLCDGWTYANWVVGTARIRDVDADWPDPQTRIHHSVGPWPLLIQDHTVALHSVPERELAIRARGWPLGEAQVVIRIDSTGPETCRLSISEDAVAGPAKLAPQPARQALIAPRNRETLYRLALIAEGRHRNRIDNQTLDGSGTSFTPGLAD